MWKVRIAKWNDNYHINDGDFDIVKEFKNEEKSSKFYCDSMNNNFFCDMTEFVNNKWEHRASSCNGNFIRQREAQ